MKRPQMTFQGDIPRSSSKDPDDIRLDYAIRALENLKKKRKEQEKLKQPPQNK